MKTSGFTLIELLIVIVIIGILVGIGVPSWEDYTRKAKRSEAVTTLLALQSAQEKLRSNCRWYASSIATTSTCGATAAATTVGMPSASGGTVDSENAYYNIAITAATVSGNSYTAVATAQNSQGGDLDCKYIAVIVDNTTPDGDLVSSSSTSGVPDTSEQCL